MSRKVKVSDVRQGVTLYLVHAFPQKGFPSYIEAMFVTKRPSMESVGLFSECKMFLDDGESYQRPFSLRDAGIIPNRYNFHNTFTSRKAAERYAARMNRKCLTKQERDKVIRRQAEDVNFRSFFGA